MTKKEYIKDVGMRVILGRRELDTCGVGYGEEGYYRNREGDLIKVAYLNMPGEPESPWEIERGENYGRETE